jgi:hypothetical protein
MRLPTVFVAACLFCLTGCATTMGSHVASMDTVIDLRDAHLAALNVGDFRLAPGLNPALDRSINARADVLHPPGGGSFSGYLRESLIGDLKTAGRYDPTASVTIEGELIDNSLSTGVSEGHAALAARFKVVRGADLLYNKELRQEEHWGSSFVGAIAIPDAINHYTAQYGQLLKQLYRDEGFRAVAGEHPAR